MFSIQNSNIVIPITTVYYNMYLENILQLYNQQIYNGA